MFLMYVYNVDFTLWDILFPSTQKFYFQVPKTLKYLNLLLTTVCYSEFFGIKYNKRHFVKIQIIYKQVFFYFCNFSKTYCILSHLLFTRWDSLLFLITKNCFLPLHHSQLSPLSLLLIIKQIMHRRRMIKFMFNFW